MKIATVFSGIGCPEYSLKTSFAEYDPEIVFACDCGESPLLDEKTLKRLSSIRDDVKRQDEVKKTYDKLRKRHWVKEVYFNNYLCLGINETKWHDDIRFINGRAYRDKIGLLIGGSPCQSFSNMGLRGGLNDVRGTLFYDYARLIKEIHPDVFIYENVPGMLTHDNGNTWAVIQGVFRCLGYRFRFSILNARDFGIPQNRKRLFVVGFANEGAGNKFKFPEPSLLTLSARDFLEKKVDAKYFLGTKGFHFVTTHPNRAKIDMKVIRTEKRNQQFNWNGDFVFVPFEEIQGDESILEKAFIGTYAGRKGAIRKMTPLECHRLMGFKDDFVICKNDIQAYKQAGNSIVVNVMTAIIHSILETGVKIK